MKRALIFFAALSAMCVPMLAQSSTALAADVDCSRGDRVDWKHDVGLIRTGQAFVRCPALNANNGRAYISSTYFGANSPSQIGTQLQFHSMHYKIEIVRIGDGTKYTSPLCGTSNSFTADKEWYVDYQSTQTYCGTGGIALRRSSTYQAKVTFTYDLKDDGNGDFSRVVWGPKLVTR